MKNHKIVKLDAVDGSLIDVDKVPLSEMARAEINQLNTTGFRTKHYQLTKGGIGCYLSHVKVWEYILRNKEDNVLIFEDDAETPSDLKNQINTYMESIPEDWDIVLFGFICSKCIKFAKYNRVEEFMLTHCYMIRKKAIVKIMKANTLFPITQQIDWKMSEMSSIVNIYSVNKKIVKQFSSRTDIQAPLFDKHNKSVYDKAKQVKKGKLV
jgi:GR25 family glycosyltransferase involved in LPS biosynthesis